MKLFSSLIWSVIQGVELLFKDTSPFFKKGMNALNHLSSFSWMLYNETLFMLIRSAIPSSKGTATQNQCSKYFMNKYSHFKLKDKIEYKKSSSWAFKNVVCPNSIYTLMSASLISLLSVGFRKCLTEVLCEWLQSKVFWR